MFMVCHNHDLVWRGYEAVLREAERDKKFAAHVAQSARRVLALKRRSSALSGFGREPKERVVKKLQQIVREFTEIVSGDSLDDRFTGSKITAERA